MMNGCCCSMRHHNSIPTVWLLAFIPAVGSVMCFANVRKGEVDEECGPNGYCFTINSTTSVGLHIRTVRGCDHTFVCETLQHSGTGQEIMQFGFRMYCRDEVKIRPLMEKAHEIIVGKLCCCNEDWCNSNYENEPKSDLEILHDLDEGTAADYEELQKIASHYNIR